MDQRPKYLSRMCPCQTRRSGKSMLFNYQADGVKDQAWQSEGCSSGQGCLGWWLLHPLQCREVGNVQALAQLLRTPNKKGVHDFSYLHEKAK